MQKILLLLLALVLANLHAYAQTGGSKDKEDVQKQMAARDAAFEKKDIPALTALFSENLQFATGVSMCKSRDECAKAFESVFKSRPDITLCL